MAQTIDFKIPAPNIKIMNVKLEGTAPLLFHKWSEKAKKMMLDKQQKKPNANKHEIRNPEEEYKNSYYRNSKGEIAIPSVWIKSSIVNSARTVEGLPMTLLRQSIFIEGDQDGLIKIDYKNEKMREDIVIIGKGSADLRYRGEVHNWKTTITVKFNADVLSAEQVLNLIQIAGFSVGIGEWRPERKGSHGTFKIVN